VMDGIRTAKPSVVRVDDQAARAGGGLRCRSGGRCPVSAHLAIDVTRLAAAGTALRPGGG
jgi:hypothetical protein